MDNYKAIIGDGQARVSVTADMGIKDFGTGVSCSVTVSLACDQSNVGIYSATALAGQAALFYVKDQRQRAEAELQQILASRPRTT